MLLAHSHRTNVAQWKRAHVRSGSRDGSICASVYIHTFDYDQQISLWHTHKVFCEKHIIQMRTETTTTKQSSAICNSLKSCPENNMLASATADGSSAIMLALGLGLGHDSMYMIVHQKYRMRMRTLS